MDLTPILRRAGVGGTIGAFIGWHAGPIIVACARVSDGLSDHVQAISMAIGLVAGGVVHAYFSKAGIEVLEPATGKDGA